MRDTLWFVSQNLRRKLRSLQSLARSIKYLYFPKPEAENIEYLANLLVAKNPIYADIAKKCVESFIYYNSKCNVVIYVDSITHLKVKKKLRKLIKRGKVSLNLLDSKDSTWQELKLNLVLNMDSSNEFFMDADLRWNGPLPILDGPKFFVEEFMFKDREPYASLVKYEFWNFGQNLSMKNTSFIYWGTFRPESKFRLIINQIMDTLQLYASQEFLEKSEKESFIRIVEQISLSVFVEYLNIPITFLKEIDGFRDGSFLESSYFGATGSVF